MTNTKKPETVSFSSDYDGRFCDKFPRAGATKEDFNAVLTWCKNYGAADITIQTDEPIWADINGRWCRITERKPTSKEIEDFITAACGNHALSLLKGGNDLDPAYDYKDTDMERTPNGEIIYQFSNDTSPKNENDEPRKITITQRYRLNVTSGRAQGGAGYQMTFRALPKTPVTLTSLPDMEPVLMDMGRLRPPNGLTLITGPTGSGKSTLLYAILRYIMESPDNYEKILDYSSPIEYTFDGVRFPNSFIHQILVGRPAGLHDPDSDAERADWAYAIRNALRRKPGIINIGESRDAATFSGCLQAAMSGHMTYSTLHTIGVAATIRRALGFYPSDERRGVALDMLQALRYVITQQLIPRADGRGKVAIREFLYFNDPIINVLTRIEPEEWPNELNRIMRLPEKQREEAGVISQTLEEHTGSLFEKGVISEGWRSKYEIHEKDDNRLLNILKKA